MLTNFNQQLYARRRRANTQGLFLSMCSMALGLTVLLWILFVLFSNGLAALDWNILTKDTPAPGSEGGGLRNAIIGSLMMVGLSVLVSTPVGILAGVYLTEYGDHPPSFWGFLSTPSRWPLSAAFQVMQAAWPCR